MRPLWTARRRPFVCVTNVVYVATSIVNDVLYDISLHLVVFVVFAFSFDFDTVDTRESRP